MINAGPPVGVSIFQELPREVTAARLTRVPLLVAFDRILPKVMLYRTVSKSVRVSESPEGGLSPSDPRRTYGGGTSTLRSGWAGVAARLAAELAAARTNEEV